MTERRPGMFAEVTLPEGCRVVGLREWRGHIYAATDRGVFRIDGNEAHRLELDGSYDGPPVFANPETGECSCWIEPAVG